MKKIVLCASILFLAFSASSQILFQKAYGELFVDYAQSMVLTSDGGYCLVGNTGPDQVDSTDMLVIGTNAAGDQVWQTRLHGAKDDYINDITTTDDGGFIIVGTTYSSPLDPTHSDIFVIKIDNTGFVYWSKTFGGLDYDEAQSVIRSGTGAYIVFGNTVSYSSVTKSALVMKIDDAGNQLWTNVSETYSSNYFYAGDRDADGNFIAVGGTFNGAGAVGFENYISKLDTNGNILWSKSNGTTGAEFLYDVKAFSTGGYIACGVSSTNTAGDADMSVMRLDESGNVMWTYNYGTPEYDRASSILERPNGDIIVSGYSNIGTVSNVVNQMMLLKLDSTGTLLWSKSYGDSSLTSESYKVIETNDGYALCGYSIANDPLGDMHLVKTDFTGESGCLNVSRGLLRTATTLAGDTGFTETISIIDEFGTTFNPIGFINQFSLICFSVGVGHGPDNDIFEIYPNPASSFIKVKSLVGVAAAKISIHDLTGRLISSKDYSGQMEMLISTEQLNSGMYLLTIETDKGLTSKTFIRE